MPEKGFHYLTHCKEQYAVIELVGELNKLAEETLLGVTDWKAVSNEVKSIVFDFTRVEYINSAGISIVIRLIRSANDEGLLLFGFGINNLQEKLFRAVGISEYIMFYPDEFSIAERLKTVG
ncbi:STAS domain-containing protein [Paenibacillus turpanensis]|uniref:STAS domain-containing protein n=1 Tax=Paenibacillus turpanensis TaxID=2689078 RepID=UPI001409F53F|nr:STAS domain-containing protein [Paenibacillus turpanensis]